MTRRRAHIGMIRVERLVARIPVAAIAAAAFAAIAVLGALGVVYLHSGAVMGVSLDRFDLDAERTVPAAFSFALLAAGAGLAWLVGRRSRRPWSWRLMAVFLAFMSLDELDSFHERLQASTGVDWEVLYLPIVLVGGVMWLLVLRAMTDRERLLWVAGAGAWFVAQVFEHFERKHEVLVYVWMTVPEELLEMTGSALWLLALALVQRRVLPRPGDPPGRVTPRTAQAGPAASRVRVG